MLTNNHLTLSTIIALVLVVGCDAGPTTPSVDPTDVVMALAAIGDAGSRGLMTDQPTIQPCPEGGLVRFEGLSNFGREGSEYLHRWDRVAHYDNCAASNDDVAVVANGSMSFAGEARFGEAAAGQRLPLLYQQSTQTGRLALKVGTTEHDCSYDVSHKYEPIARHYNVTGNVCGKHISIIVPEQF